MNDQQLLYVGVDPGVYGAIAVIDKERRVLLLTDLPNVKVLKAPKKKLWKNSKTGETRTVVSRSRTEMDFQGLSELMGRVVDLPGQKHVLIERVSAMVGDSGIAAFTFGGAFWALQQAMTDFNLTYGLVGAKEWQKHCLGVPEKDREARRNQYLERARVLFPGTDLSHKKDAEKAAALLIADYCCEMSTYMAENLVDLDAVKAPDFEDEENERNE